MIIAIVPRIATAGTAIYEITVSDLIPKYADAVIHTPATITSTHSATTLPPRSSLATGIANIATPTPNQPICVNDIIADGR